MGDASHQCLHCSEPIERLLVPKRARRLHTHAHALSCAPLRVGEGQARTTCCMWRARSERHLDCGKAARWVGRDGVCAELAGSQHQHVLDGGASEKRWKRRRD